MKKEQEMERRQAIRMARRAFRNQQRHRRSMWLGVAAGVVLLLGSSFLVGRMMKSSSARTAADGVISSVSIVTSEESQALEGRDVSIEYMTRDKQQESASLERKEKSQRQEFGPQLDCFLRLTTDATLYARASTKSNAVVALEAGTIVESYGTEQEWTQVTSRGYQGYIRNRDLEVIRDAKLFKVVDGKVIVNANYGLDPSYETVFNEDAAAGLRVMLEAMRRDGLTVEVATTYRSYQEEEKELVLRGKPEHAPQAGHAVFQTGYGVQFHAPNTDPRLDNDFEKTEQFAWLKAHAPEYGFILRYPEGSESMTGYRADPSIFYYVGVEDASIISNEGLTMEVFYGVHE